MSGSEWVSVVGAATGLAAVLGTVGLGIFALRYETRRAEVNDARKVLSAAGAQLALAAYLCGNVDHFVPPPDPELDRHQKDSFLVDELRDFAEAAQSLLDPLAEQNESVILHFGVDSPVAQAFESGTRSFQVAHLGASVLTQPNLCTDESRERLHRHLLNVSTCLHLFRKRSASVRFKSVTTGQPLEYAGSDPGGAK